VAVFRWVNEGWSNPFFDRFFSFITDFHNFYLLLIPIFVYWFIWDKAKSGWLILSLFVGVLLSDQIASHVLKYIVERVRPCNALTGVLTPDGHSSSFSFPSSHAANMGSAVFLLSKAFKPWTPLFVIIALLVGLSRVYLGLHYPSDVLGGYVLGLTLGYIVWCVVEKLKVRFAAKPQPIKKAGRSKSKKRVKRG
jgi:undecaprenyl-diphosphatase